MSEAVGEQHRELARVERGAVPRDAQDTGHAIREGPGDTEGDRGRLSLLSGVPDQDRPVLSRVALDALLVRHDDRALHPGRLGEREQHVADHRAGEREPQLIVDALAEALLGQ